MSFGSTACRLVETAHTCKRWQKPVIRDEESCRVLAENVDVVEVEATQIELVADLQRRQQVLLHGGHIFAGFNFPVLSSGSEDGAMIHPCIEASYLTDSFA